jgi:pimeloyl-ACP methyl ester carboxylesterase
MTPLPIATAVDEQPVFFPAAGEDLFGIVTTPPGVRRGIAAVVLSGGGVRGAGGTPSPGRNRVWVRLARRLAGAGFHAFRIDYRGVGDSSGESPEYRLDRPFVDDVEGAADWLRAEGINELVLLGACFGGRTALAAAAGGLDGVRGVAVYGSPVRDFEHGARLESLPLSWWARRARSMSLERLLDPERRAAYRRLAGRKLRRSVRRRAAGETERFQWVSPVLVSHLQALVDRGIPVLLVYSEHDDFYQDLCRGRQGPIGPLLDHELVRLELVAAKVHGLTSRIAQQAVIDATERWLLEVVAPTQVGDVSPAAQTR